MFGFLLLGVLAFIVWKLWLPALSFAQGFRSLLERPTGRTGIWPFLKGTETVAGEYDGRPTLLILHHKRDEHSLGYLVVAMQPAGGAEIEKKQTGVFREWIREPAAREAWDDLELQHELKLSFSEGWMRVVWQPTGFFSFPGPFNRARWQQVLRSMHTVVTSLEGGA